MVRRSASHDPWGNAEVPLRVPDIHAYSLETSVALSEYCVPGYIKPLDLIAVLTEVDIRSVLLGSHGMGGWRRQPRASRKTVLLVGSRSHSRAVRLLVAAYPRLLAEQEENGTRLRDLDPMGVVIDVWKPVQPLLHKALVKTHTVQADGRACLIPSLETALALLFDPMIRLDWGSPEKYEHAGDFIRIVECNPDLDLKEVASLCELIYEGAGAEAVTKVKRLRAGEKLNL